MGAESEADQSFVDFVRAHTPSLYRTALLLTHNAPGAEELLQETLARLYPRWDRVQAADSPTAYVRRSLVNAYLSAQRRPAGRDVAMWTLPDIADARDNSDPARTVADRDAFWSLLGALPERQRAAMVLRYGHDWTDADIAAALGCRPVTVRSLISRALRSLRTIDTADPDLRAVTRRRGLDPIRSTGQEAG